MFFGVFGFLGLGFGVWGLHRPPNYPPIHLKLGPKQRPLRTIRALLKGLGGPGRVLGFRAVGSRVNQQVWSLRVLWPLYLYRTIKPKPSLTSWVWVHNYCCSDCLAAVYVYLP